MQSQREHAVTQDIVVRNADPEARWQWLCGAFAFGKRLDMSSPVTFKRDGIDDLILDNANKHIHDQFPDNDIEIGTDSFVIASDFRIPVYGAALYHESSARLGRWTLTAGLRFDYEYTSMKYDSRSELPYRFNLTMPEFKMLHTRVSQGASASRSSSCCPSCRQPIRCVVARFMQPSRAATRREDSTPRYSPTYCSRR